MSDSELQVFISSKMRRNALKAERKAAVEAVTRFPGLTPWNWETCSYAAPYPPMEICLDAVKKSNMLILLLGSDLTDHTREEHETAVRLGIPDFVFVKDGMLKKETRAYLNGHKNRMTYMLFKSVNELKTLITSSLREEIVLGYRKGRSLQIGTHASYSSSPPRRRNG